MIEKKLTVVQAATINSHLPRLLKLVDLEELEQAGMKFSMADWEFDNYEAMFDVDTNTERPTSR